MFLFYLNDSCKEDVMDLSIHVAKANDILENEELNSLAQYYHELGLENRGYNAFKDCETVCNDLIENTTEREKRMILFEITALACIDGVCDKKERDLLDYICDSWKISANIIDEIMVEIGRLSEVYSEIAVIIKGEK